MRSEVESAVGFLAKLLNSSGRWSSAQIQTFHQTLFMILCNHYQNHWFPEKPFKGSAYRCLRYHTAQMDPLIQRAAAEAGISRIQLVQSLPAEMTIWVDPQEVSYRFGEEGSIGVIYPGDDEFLEQETSQSGSESDCSMGSEEYESEYPQYGHHHHQGANSPDFFQIQSCKDQLRSYLPGQDVFDRVNFEFIGNIANFVAS